MVNEVFSMKVISLLIFISAFSGLVSGDEAVMSFPQPGDSLEGESPDSIGDIGTFALDFVVWPFEILGWFWSLTALEFVEGTPGWVSGTLKVIMIAATGIAILPIGLRIIDALGQIIPLT